MQSATERSKLLFLLLLLLLLHVLSNCFRSWERKKLARLLPKEKRRLDSACKTLFFFCKKLSGIHLHVVREYVYNMYIVTLYSLKFRCILNYPSIYPYKQPKNKNLAQFYNYYYWVSSLQQKDQQRKILFFWNSKDLKEKNKTKGSLWISLRFGADEFHNDEQTFEACHGMMIMAILLIKRYKHRKSGLENNCLKVLKSNMVW